MGSLLRVGKYFEENCDGESVNVVELDSPGDNVEKDDEDDEGVNGEGDLLKVDVDVNVGSAVPEACFGNEDKKLFLSKSA